MAQLVARFHGMEEATGSNPVSSTIREAREETKSLSGFRIFEDKEMVVGNEVSEHHIS